jgi:hypothetical protein
MAKYHPDADISEVIEYALSLGWRYTWLRRKVDACPHSIEE